MLDDMHNGRNIAIIVAAGSGSRMGSEIPKQFLMLEALEVLSYSVRSLGEHPSIDDVIIVTSPSFKKGVAERYPECLVTLGGETRQDSVFNGLSACPKDTRLVLVHDAARPLIPGHVIDDCLEKLETFDGVAPAIVPVDSMVQLSSEGFINLDRKELRVVQTPQCFHIDILLKAHATKLTDTDELGLVKQAIPGAKLTFVQGAPETMKITQPHDVEIAAMYLRSMET